MRLRDLEILRWAHGGAGLAIPVGGPLAGRVVFVEGGAVPGDRVVVDVLKANRRWARARLVAIEVPSGQRVAPPCPLQARCGGCPWMVGSLELQAASRLAILTGEAHKRLGWSDEEAAVRVGLAEVPGAAALGYRARLRLAWKRARGTLVLGYRARRSHDLIDVRHCAVASPALNAALGEARARAQATGARAGEVRLIAGEEGVAVSVEPTGGAPELLGPEAVTVRFGARVQRASPATFVQANPTVAAAIGDAIEGAAWDLGGAHAVELFAGSGLLTQSLWAAGYTVDAYEVDPSARAPFEAAAAASGSPKSRWHRADLLSIGLVTPPPAARPDLVLLDPPRGGADPVMPWIRASGAARVLMVSCDVATAFRDLATLVADGRYRVTEVRGYDMFPHTGHQEVFAVAEPVG